MMTSKFKEQLTCHTDFKREIEKIYIFSSDENSRFCSHDFHICHIAVLIMIFIMLYFIIHFLIHIDL